MAEKQKAHPSAQEQQKAVLKRLDDMREDMSADTYKPQLERAKQPGNPNPVAPEDRTIQVPNRAADIAAGHISAASAAIQNHDATEARLNADPRRERDQRVYEFGQTGKLGFVPPSEVEMVAHNIAPEEAEKAPKTPEEQVADDMKRLDQAEQTAQEVTSRSTNQQPESSDKDTASKRDEQKGTVIQ